MECGRSRVATARFASQPIHATVMPAQIALRQPRPGGDCAHARKLHTGQRTGSQTFKQSPIHSSSRAMRSESTTWLRRFRADLPRRKR